MKHYFICLFILIVGAQAMEFKPTSAPVELENGDHFAFIGNSITHQCLYTQYVEDYYYTRFPAKRLYFHNTGVSGDFAGDVLARLDDDILIHQPKYATILIGMNDGEYRKFDHEVLENYKRDMTMILDRLKSAGIKAIPMTPTMFDLRAHEMLGEEAKIENASAIHYNATLSFFGMWCLQMANDRGLGFVNMFEPLNRITRKGRDTDPEFTLIEDAVHPGPAGQLIMALALLEDIGATPIVSDIHINVQGRSWNAIEVVGGELIPMAKRELRFAFNAQSLPWVVPDDAQTGYELCDAGSRMSVEQFAVTGLKTGSYELLIDETIIGRYDNLQLAAGIQLQNNPKTPQYQQSLKIAEFNKKRNEEHVGELRDLWLVKKILDHVKNNPDELEPGEWEEIQEWLGIENVDEFFVEFDAAVQQELEAAADLEAELYGMNNPIEHIYELRLVK